MMLCKLGVHRPLKIGMTLFVDKVSHKDVREAFCPCGIRWMVDSTSPWFGFKMTAKPETNGESDA